MTTHLYTCRTPPEGYGEFIITKMDDDYRQLSRYQLSEHECSCPQGAKPTCRHRKMLKHFIHEGHVDDGWFFNWDNKQWRPPINLQPEPTSPMSDVVEAPPEGSVDRPTPGGNIFRRRIA